MAHPGTSCPRKMKTAAITTFWMVGFFPSFPLRKIWKMSSRTSKPTVSHRNQQGVKRFWVARHFLGGCHGTLRWHIQARWFPKKWSVTPQNHLFHIWQPFESQCIHGAFHTRQMHTSCKWGHAKMAHTPLSRPFNRGRLCKNEGRTMQNCRSILEDSRTQEKTMENEAAQAKNEGQHIHGAFHTRQMYKSCKWGHAKLAHTSLQAIQSGKTMQKWRQNHAKL